MIGYTPTTLQKCDVLNFDEALKNKQPTSLLRGGLNEASSLHSTLQRKFNHIRVTLNPQPTCKGARKPKIGFLDA